jgi:hypothetical protein
MKKWILQGSNDPLAATDPNKAVWHPVIDQETGIERLFVFIRPVLVEEDEQ